MPRDLYLERVQKIAAELIEISDAFSEQRRDVLSDLTYMVVADDIMDVLRNS